MIIIRLAGGLGNQMFQYAFYLKLCSLGYDVRFDDVNGYNQPEETVRRRKIQLCVFGIDYPAALPEDITRLRDADMHFFSRIRRKLFGRHSLEIRDEDYVFDPSFLQRENAYYTGYFQSEHYFSGLRERVADTFCFPGNMQGMTDAIGKTAACMLQENSAAVHLRFGDYIDKADVYGEICTKEYYRAAMELLCRSTEGIVHFYIFSNDYEQAEKFLKEIRGSSGEQTDAAAVLSHADYTLISGRDEEHGYLDLYLMSHCRNFILANSSFSWWGAWIGRYGKTGRKKAGLTIAPSLWIHCPDGSDLKRTDIFTDDMIRMNAWGKVTYSGHTGLPCEEPLVSVIVAAYNIARYLPRAIGSLLNQTWKNLEIIISDDGSEDDTAALSDRFASSDSRVVVIHDKNGGLSEARNRALAVARGEYIGFLDGDDWAEPEMIESMVRGCLTGNAGIAVVNYRQVADAAACPAMPARETARDIDGILAQSVLLDKHRALDCYLLSDQEIVIRNSVWSKLFRRDIVRDLRFPAGRKSEDILFTTKTMMRTGRCCCIRTLMYNYVTGRADSIMNIGAADRRMKDELPFWLQQIRLLKEAGLDRQSGEAVFGLYRRLLDYDLDFRSHAETRKYAGELENFAVTLQDELKPLLQQPYVSRGEKLQMMLFMHSPKLYEKVYTWYGKTVVPVKRRMAGTKKTGEPDDHVQ